MTVDDAVEEWRERAEKAERERDSARFERNELQKILNEVLKHFDRTSDLDAVSKAYGDIHKLESRTLGKPSY